MPKLPRGMFRRKGTRSFYVRVRRNGRDRWTSLGSDYTEACRKLARIRGGEVPASRLTVDQATQHWIKAHVALNRVAAHQKVTEGRVRLHLSPFMGYHQLGRLTKGDVRAYRVALEEMLLGEGRREEAAELARRYGSKAN